MGVENVLVNRHTHEDKTGIPMLIYLSDLLTCSLSFQFGLNEC